MKRLIQLPRQLLIAILFLACPLAVDARSYSSGGGHSYSSHSSSHSSSSSHSFSSPSHSFSSGGSSSSSSSHSSSSGSSSHSSASGSGKSYSSGSSSDDSNRRSYSSGKSYNSGSSFSSSSKRSSSSGNNSSSASDDFNYDTAAARARKEQASIYTFTHYNQSRNPPPIRDNSPSAPPIIPRHILVPHCIAIRFTFRIRSRFRRGRFACKAFFTIITCGPSYITAILTAVCSGGGCSINHWMTARCGLTIIAPIWMRSATRRC